LAARVVVDASVLIVLAKLRCIHLLRAVYGTILLGPVVHHEVVTQGQRLRARGVEQVEQALEESWLQVVRPTTGEQKLTVRLLRTTRLDDGEAEALALASRRKLLLVADDKEARHVAEALGIAYVGTAGVLLEAYLRQHLTLAGLEDVLTDLTKVLWLSPTVVAAVLKKAREAKQ
jgi:predicted nucleic acid-binding protein